MLSSPWMLFLAGMWIIFSFCICFSLDLANIGTQTAGGRTAGAGAVVRGVSQYKYSAGVRNVQQFINDPAPVVHQVTCTPVIFRFVLELNLVMEWHLRLCRSYFKKKVEAKMSLVYCANDVICSQRLHSSIHELEPPYQRPANPITSSQ